MGAFLCWLLVSRQHKLLLSCMSVEQQREDASTAFGAATHAKAHRCALSCSEEILSRPWCMGEATHPPASSSQLSSARVFRSDLVIAAA